LATFLHKCSKVLECNCFEHICKPRYCILSILILLFIHTIQIFISINQSFILLLYFCGFFIFIKFQRQNQKHNGLWARIRSGSSLHMQ
jgi:hypothetical protein